jgi:hypothetical protein
MQIIVLNAIAVSIAMYCLIQFYVQLKDALAEHKLFVKIVAIKLVVFLSFWQASAISVGTSTLQIVHANEVVAYPDLKVGIPALLLCVEMALFAILHLWAFPYAPYKVDAPRAFYPSPDANKDSSSVENERQAPSGGSMGMLAIFDALNLWDFIKAFGRGMRWLFCGVKRRKEDVSYRLGQSDGLDMDHLPDKDNGGSYDHMRAGAAAPGTGHDDYESGVQNFGRPSAHPAQYHSARVAGGEERAGLMDNAQPNPETRAYGASPPRPRRQPSPYEVQHDSPYQQQTNSDAQQTGVAQRYHDGSDGSGRR